MNIKEKEVLLCSKYNSINRLLAIHDVGRQDREDLLQEIFINAFRFLEKLKDPDKMDAWLWKITRNEVNRYWKEVMNTREMEISLEEEGVESQISEMSDAEYNGLLSDIDKMCERDELVRALKQLKRNTLIVLRLFYFEGYKLREIAQITGETEGAVKSRQQRAIKQLRKIMEKSSQTENDTE